MRRVCGLALDASTLEGQCAEPGEAAASSIGRVSVWKKGPWAAIVKRLFAIALLIAACGGQSSPSAAGPGDPPSPFGSRPPQASSSPCTGAVGQLGAFTRQMAGDLASLRPLVVVPRFDPGAAVTASRRVSATLTAYAGLERTLGACEATIELGQRVETLRASADATLEKAFSTLITDARVQRGAAASLFKLMPEVLALSKAGETVAQALGTGFEIAQVPAGAAQPIGSLPPLPTPSSTPTPQPPPTPTRAPGSTSVFETEGFAGYVASGGAFRSTTISWIEPKITCTAGAYSAVGIWVGIQDDTSKLQQAGTFAICDRTRGLIRRSFWEAFPEAAVPFAGPIPVTGHRMTAKVSVKGSLWTYVVKDLTTGKSASANHRVMMAPLIATWLVERPPLPGSVTNIGPLARFGPYRITSAGAASGTATGPINGGDWRSIRTSMIRNGRTLATVSALSSSGRVFTVKFVRSD